jgi:hypothetical protein
MIEEARKVELKKVKITRGHSAICCVKLPVQELLL